MENSFSFPFIEKFVLKSLDSCLIESACIAAGLDTFRLSPLMIVAKDRVSGKFFPFFRTASGSTSVPGRQICGYKQWTRQVLDHQGILVPNGRVFLRKQTEEALDFADELGWPVVLKPSAGTGGVMVTANIPNRARLLELISQFEEEEPFIVEKHCEGQDYRILVVGGSVVSVLRRERASVVGDGALTVRELIRQKNKRRRMNPRLRNSLIKPLGPTVKNTLEGQGIELSSVPQTGQVVALSTAANVSSGGECWDVTDETHPDIIGFIEEAMAVLPGVRYAGFDVLICDHTQDLSKQGAWICEVNSSAEIAMHEFAPKGTVKAISRAIVSDLLEHEGLRNDFNDLRAARITIQLGQDVEQSTQEEVNSWCDELSLSGHASFGTREIVLEVEGGARELATISGMAVSPKTGINAESCEVTLV